MLPVPSFLTVMMPFSTVHVTGVWSLTLTHSSVFLPSKRMMASDGAAPTVDAGVTTGGTGFQISVSSGLGLLPDVGAGCWAAENVAATRAARIESRRMRIFFIAASLPSAAQGMFPGRTELERCYAEGCGESVFCSGRYVNCGVQDV